MQDNLQKEAHHLLVANFIHSASALPTQEADTSSYNKKQVVGISEDIGQVWKSLNLGKLSIDC